MRVESLYVCQFRNLEKQEVILAQGVNELIGGNAEGKTSLLEAIHLLILGNSFRTNQLRDLIKHGEKAFFIEARVTVSGVEKLIALRYDGERRSVILDGETQETTSSLLGNLLGVTTTPEDQELIFGPPAIRRRFLDEQISQIDPFYLEQLKRYSRALCQRNKLLKSKEFQTIAAWEEQLAKSGAYIVHQRRATIDLLLPMVHDVYKTLFPREGALSMQYFSQPPSSEKDIEAWYMKQYGAKREYESRVATTLVGPHRDDIEWTLHERPFRGLASLGQARSVALALRLAEWKLLFDRSHEEPIFLIDDFESSLDSERRAFMLKTCMSFEQVILTAHALQNEKSSRISLF